MTFPWREIIGFLLVLAAAAGLWFFGAGLEAGQPLLFACLLLAILCVVLHRLWRFLLGPLFFYDLVRTARLNRLIPLRVLFAVALLVMLFYQYSEWFSLGDWESLFQSQRLAGSSHARFVESVFFTIQGGEFLAVLLLTPAITAGVIAEEHERRTIEFLFATALTDREIVLGCLAARLATLGLLLLTALPFLCLLQFLGGIGPELIFAGLVVTLVTTFSVGSISMLISVHCRRAHIAIIGSYVLVAFYLACSSCIPGLSWGNPGRLLFSSAAGLEAMEALLVCFLLHGVIGSVCLVMAVVQLRGLPASMERLVRPPPPPRAQPPRTATPVALPPRYRPRVSEPPMLWKELHVEHRLSPALTVVCITLGLIFLFFALLGLAEMEPSNYARGAGAVMTSFVLFLIPFLSGGAVSREREQRTLEMLLATPLDKDDILFAKLVGSLYPTRWFWPFLAFGWSLTALLGRIHPLAFLLQVSAWLVFGAFFASLGLLFSTVFRTTLRSLLFAAISAMAILGASVTTTFTSAASLSIAMPENTLSEWLSRFVDFGLAPGRALYVLAFTGDDLKSPQTGAVANLMAAAAGVLCYGAAAVLLWQTTRWLFRRQTEMPVTHPSSSALASDSSH